MSLLDPGRTGIGPWKDKDIPPRVRNVARGELPGRHRAETGRKDTERLLTPNQLHDLLETDQGRTLVEGAEERGYIEPVELEAFVLEHDLNEDEVEQLTRELEAIGLEIGQPQAQEADPVVEAPQIEPEALSGSADSLQLFLADVGRHKLLTA